MTRADIASQLATAAQERIARAYMVGVDECRENGRALTQLQQIDLLRGLLGCADGLTDDLRAVLDLEETLWRLGESARGEA